MNYAEWSESGGPFILRRSQMARCPVCGGAASPISSQYKDAAGRYEVSWFAACDDRECRCTLGMPLPFGYDEHGPDHSTYVPRTIAEAMELPRIGKYGSCAEAVDAWNGTVAALCDEATMLGIDQKPLDRDLLDDFGFRFADAAEMTNFRRNLSIEDVL